MAVPGFGPRTAQGVVEALARESARGGRRGSEQDPAVRNVPMEIARDEFVTVFGHGHGHGHGSGVAPVGVP